MYKNYFLLNRLTIELNQLLTGYRLYEAFSQDKDTLVLSFELAEDEKHLIISVNQNDTSCLLKSEFSRARKNSVDFFSRYLPSKLERVEIAAGDRIIRFIFSGFSLYYYIRGKDTNIAFYSADGLFLPFKKTDDPEKEKITGIIKSTTFSPFFLRPWFNDESFDLPLNQYISKNYPFIGKEIFAETISRMSSENIQEFKDRLDDVLDEVERNNYAVFFDKASRKLIFSFVSFHIFEPSDIKEFKSYSEALMNYLGRKFKSNKKEEVRALIERSLKSQMSRISAKLTSISGKLEEPSKEDHYRETGQILLSNINLLRTGMKEIELVSFFEDNDKVNIKLDETLTPKDNIERYFRKAKAEKQNRIHLTELKQSLELSYKKLLEKKHRLEKSESIEEYKQLMSEMNIKENSGTNAQKEESGFNFKHYIIDEKYNLFVGKDSRSNDNLTCRFAKQNDYWFHARGVPGSHAVLRVDNSKEVVPKPVLKKAASIAAFHSKAKTAKMAPVAFTLKKYVTKKKGMEPGKVALLKEEVLLVSPGIPDGCAFVDE